MTEREECKKAASERNEETYKTNVTNQKRIERLQQAKDAEMSKTNFELRMKHLNVLASGEMKLLMKFYLPAAQYFSEL